MFVGHLRVRQVHLISHATSRVLFHGRTALTAATMPTRQHWRMLLLLLSACTQYLSCIQAVAVQLLDGLIDRNLPERLPTPVIFDHDAGIDDFITLMLLLSQPQHVKLLVSPAKLHSSIRVVACHCVTAGSTREYTAHLGHISNESGNKQRSWFQQAAPTLTHQLPGVFAKQTIVESCRVSHCCLGVCQPHY